MRAPIIQTLPVEDPAKPFRRVDSDPSKRYYRRTLKVPKVLVREPRLMVPGQMPVGSVRVTPVSGLAFAWIARPAINIPLFGGGQMTAVGAGYYGVSKGSQAYIRTSTDQYLYGSYAPVITSDGSGTGDFSFITVVYQRASAGAPSAICGQYVATTGANAAGLQFDSNAAGNTEANSTQFFTTSGGSNSAVAISSSVYQGYVYSVGCSRVGTNLNLVVHNLDTKSTITGTTSATVRDIHGSSSEMDIGILRPYNARAGQDIIYNEWLNIGLPIEILMLWAKDPFMHLIPT